MFFVEFTPPNSNTPKRAKVEYKGEGYVLRDWLRSVGATAELILVTEDVDILDDPLQNAF